MNQDDRTSGGHIGLPDVQWVEACCQQQRMRDYQYGGGTCKDAVLGHLRQVEPMLKASASTPVRTQLHTAVADLHNLAGWVLFDTGHAAEAHGYLARSLELAYAGGNHGLLANIHYRIGRIHLHHGDPASALTEFQHGAEAASDSPLTTAILSVNQAWVSAIMGQACEALALLGQAFDAFASTGRVQPPPWAAFFDETDLTAMSGIVHTELARRVDSSYTTMAIPALATAITGYGETMTRSRTFALISLATNHLVDGDVDHATLVGTQALAGARNLTSSRVIDRLRPLHHELRHHRTNSNARDLTEQISQLIPSRPLGFRPRNPTEKVADPGTRLAWPTKGRRRGSESNRAAVTRDSMSGKTLGNAAILLPGLRSILVTGYKHCDRSPSCSRWVDVPTPNRPGPR